MKHAKSRRFSEIRLSFTLAAIIYIVLGLLLILMPNTSRKLLCTLVGAGVTVYGALNVVSYLLDKNSSAYTLQLLIGVCALALGVFSLFRPTFLMDFLFIALGLIAVVSALGGVRRALRLRSFGFARWKAMLLTPAAIMLLALSSILFPGLYGNLLMMLLGALLVCGGVCDLAGIHFLSGYMKP